MKKIFYLLGLCFFTNSLYSQANLEVEGKAKISQMDIDNSADSIVVRQNDGTLAIRDVSSLAEYQILSISNDTIFLSNGGFVKLPAEVDGSTTNELQTIMRTGLAVTLSDGGGTYQDSINVYTAGSGIAITNNVISTTGGSSSPWYLGKDTLGGIVYYIYKGSDGMDHGLIVSKTETTAQWQSTTSTTNADRTWDGEYNTNLMTNSPAKTWITTNFTSEWYLPSIDELSLLWHNRFHANKALNDASATLFSLTVGYWSSTEGITTNAWIFTFYNGNAGIGNFNKTDTQSVRAIRAF